MGIFRRSKPLTLGHPSLGQLQWDGTIRTWDGSVLFIPIGADVSINLYGSETGPDAAAVHALQELTAIFESLVPKLAEALYSLFQPYIEALSLRDAESPAQLWHLVRLDMIAVVGPGHIELVFGLAQEGVWDDAMLNIQIKQGVIVKTWLDD